MNNSVPVSRQFEVDDGVAECELYKEARAVFQGQMWEVNEGDMNCFMH